MKQQFTDNRAKLAALIGPGGLAVVNANDVMPTNSDGTMRYRANNDLYWLTGIGQEETILVLFPHHPDKNQRETLFIKRPDHLFAKWHGYLVTAEHARDISGIAHVRYLDEFETLFHTMAVVAETIYLNAIEHPRSVNQVQTRDDRFARRCRQKYSLHTFSRLAPLLATLRTVKNGHELALLKKACDISGHGFRRLLRFVKPGMTGKLLEAELIHEYMQHGGEWSGYAPIMAAGAHSCILHYIENTNLTRYGEPLLVDAAASYGLYNADLTRVIPVGGRFTTRQKQIYNAVLAVHRDLKKFAHAGLYWREVEAYKNERVVEELVKLDLVTFQEARNPAMCLDRYSYHGFGHFIGLDVHDVGHLHEKMPVNTVLTIEPGIYVQEDGIGVRLENVVVLTADGTNDLMAGIPIDADEIETIMNA